MSEHEISWLERWFFRMIVRKSVQQGNHKNRITALYREIHHAFNKEFTEDTAVTRTVFLWECFINSQDND